MLLGVPQSVLAGILATDTDFANRVLSQLIIKDYNAAIQEGKIGLSIFPNSKEILSSLVTAYSREGRSQDAILIFEQLIAIETFDLKKHFSLLEDLSWGVLLDATSQAQTCYMQALIGAYLTHDAKAIPFFIEALRSSNAYLRAFSARLSAQYKDKLLGLELVRLIQDEKNWFVRLEVLDAIGGFSLKEAKPVLQNVVVSTESSAEERVLAIKALSVLYDEFPSDERRALLTSQKGGLRQLGLELIKEFRLNNVILEVLPLLQDPCLHVRLSALHLLSTMKLEIKDQALALSKIEALLEDPHPNISLSSAWVMMQYDSTKAAKIFEKWLSCSQQKTRRFAASVLSSTGFLGSIYLQKHFHQVDDPYVKANLALGMLGQRIDVAIASDFLFTFLKTTKHNLTFDHRDHPIFPVLMPSEHRHVPHIPRYPLLVDQFTRLDILNRLSIVGYEKSEDVIRSFLREGLWGITGSAAGVLIEDGDFQAVDIVRNLLKDKDEKVVLQAALALAFFAKEVSVRSTLENSFDKVEWDCQVHILQALGSIGDRESIPFLLKILEKPFQELRIIAASSIIQCLYH
jgi:HEAT repeat protein